MKGQSVSFIIATICFLVGIATCIYYLKKGEMWDNLKSSMIVSIENKIHLILGVIVGVITYIVW